MSNIIYVYTTFHGPSFDHGRPNPKVPRVEHGDHLSPVSRDPILLPSQCKVLTTTLLAGPPAREAHPHVQ